jgi:hypothetical protein
MSIALTMMQQFSSATASYGRQSATGGSLMMVTVA